MLKLHNKGVVNKLIMCIIVAILLCNFAMPNYSYATTDPENGGKLLEAIAKFFAHLCDKVMEWLQHTFVTTEDIEQENGSYNFQYTPAIIFSGTVPALDINFINPNEESREGLLAEEYIKSQIFKWSDKAVQGDSQHKDYYEKAKTISGYKHISGKENAKSDIGDPFAYNEDFVKYEVYYKKDEKNKTLNVYCEIFKDASNKPYYYSAQFKLSDLEANGYYRNYESTAKKLQGTIASWYKALRRIALVGLLSVLVYLGIRIVLASSSPQDQSKYKKMIVDWIIAICLLFTLHYIMSLTLTVTSEISKIFNPGDTDQIFNTLREKIQNGDSWGAVTGEVIMYITLSVFTIIFTVQYLKRVIYMAFFTLIAPLITLTYPLDKIKDNEAQAFTMWIREYIFTALIQVIHLVIYYVLIGSALELVENYTLYAIIAIIFMKQAENIVKRMFGFDKAETVGALGAATTGALIMNAINQLKKPPKASGGKEDTGNVEGTPEQGTGGRGLRTANTTGIDPLQALKGDTERADRFKELLGQGMTQEEAINTLNKEIPFDRNKKQENIGKGEKALKGAGTLLGRYTRPVLRTGAGILGSMAGGAIGFAAGASQGDIGKAITGLAAGGTAGYYGGQRLTDATFDVGNKIRNVGNTIREVGDTYLEGAEGKEYVEKVRFKRTQGYKDLTETANFSEESIDKMLAAGMRDPKEMEEILNKGGANIEEEIGYYELAKQCPDEILFGDKENLQEYLKVILKKSNLDPSLAERIGNEIKKYR